MQCIQARGLRKTFGATVALDGIDLRIEEGRIVGLIGPNGAGKTTALNAILGLIPYDGHLTVLGRNPWAQRDNLMRDVEHVLTDVLFIDRGRLVFESSMEEVESRYLEVIVHPERVVAARALNPLYSRQAIGRSILLFEGADREQLAALGDVRTPSIADLFVAVVGAAR